MNKPVKTYVTVHDVARAAGVSAQTVSRVVNEREGVAEATRLKVRKAMDELGYFPNRAAQMMHTRRSYQIQVISFLLDFTQPFPRMVRAAQEAGYHLNFALGYDGQHIQAIRSAAELMVDGVVWMFQITSITEAEIAHLSGDIPFVVLGGHLGSPLPSVAYNQSYGVQLAIEHLVSLGHCSIACIHGASSNLDSMIRYQAWLEQAKLHGLDPDLYVRGDFTSPSGYYAFQKLREQNTDFTAVLTANDDMALGAIAAAHEMGLRVPEDVSIVGTDDRLDASYFLPPLTTIRYDFGQQGEMAIKYLIEIIENPSVPAHQRLMQPSLVVRQSTRPPRH